MGTIFSDFEDIQSDESLHWLFCREVDAFKQAHPGAPRQQLVLHVISKMKEIAPKAVQLAIAAGRRRPELRRRGGQLEQAKSRTHGLEYNGEMTGGNFGSEF